MAKYKIIEIALYGPSSLHDFENIGQYYDNISSNNGGNKQYHGQTIFGCYGDISPYSRKLDNNIEIFEEDGAEKSFTLPWPKATQFVWQPCESRLIAKHITGLQTCPQGGRADKPNRESKMVYAARRREGEFPSFLVTAQS